MRIPLQPGDRIVAAVQVSGDVLIFTEQGCIYLFVPGPSLAESTVQLL